MKMIKSKFILLNILAVFLAACSQDERSLNDLTQEESYAIAQNVSDYGDSQMLPFAKALYHAMKESPELRELIKNESLKQFDKEYEVLYQFIKDEKLGNRLSVRDLLLKYFSNDKSLAVFESKHPTLTIHIPILPEGSFSAEIWNAKEQIPAVAIHQTSFNSSTTLLVAEKGQYNNKSETFVMKAREVPGFPVIVLKENARVVVSKNGKSKSPSLNNKNSDYVFDFIDDYFDGSIKDKDAAPDLRSLTYWGAHELIDIKAIEAYNIYGASNGWQRDYIYYNLTPTNTTGSFCNNFKESVICFKFSDQHTPQQVFNYINNSPSTDPPFPWTSGQYNFKIEVQVVSKSGSSLITQYFAAYPTLLFAVTFTKSGNTYIPTFTGFGILSLNIPLITWNLGIYSEAMTISVSKLSPSATSTQQSVLTSEFVTNVTQTDKNGVQYGNSSKSTYSATVTRTFQVNDVPLGDVVMYFYDPVIADMKPIYSTLLGMTVNASGLIDYRSGFYILNIIPVKQY